MKKLAVVLCLIFVCSHFACAAQKPEIFVQTGCLGEIRLMCLSPDEKTFLTYAGKSINIAGEPLEGAMKLWNVASGKEIRTFEGGHLESVNSACFSPDGKYILTASDDKTLKLWDVATGEEIRTFSGHNKEVNEAVITPDGKYALSGGTDNVIKLWNLETGEVVKTTYAHGKGVQCVSLTADGTYALTNSPDGNIHLWDMKTLEVIKSYQSHIRDKDAYSHEYYSKYYPYRSIISANGQYALLAAQYSFELIELSTGKKLLLYAKDKKKGSELGSICLSADNRYIYYTFQRGCSIHVYSTEKKKIIREFSLGEGQAAPICPFQDGKRLLFNASDSRKYKYEAKLWDMVEEKEIITYGGGYLPRPVIDVHVLENGNSFLTGDKYFQLWDLKTGKLYPSFHGWGNGAGGERDGDGEDAVSADGRYCLYPFRGGGALWEVQTKRLLTTLGMPTVNCAAFAPDGNWAVAGSMKGMYAFNIKSILANGKTHLDFSGDTVYAKYYSEKELIVNAVCYSPDGKYVLSGNAAGKLTLWIAERLLLAGTGQEKKISLEWAGHAKPISNVSFSSAGQYALSTSYGDCEIKQWKVPGGELVRTFSEHTKPVYAACFSPAGKFILSASRDKTIKLWDVETGKVVKTMRGHRDIVRSVCFLPDGRHALSCSNDGTVRLWNVFAGEEIAMFVSFPNGEWVCVTPEGYYNASANAAKYVNIRLGDTVYSLDTYAEKYYRPELKLLSAATK